MENPYLPPINPILTLVQAEDLVSGKNYLIETRVNSGNGIRTLKYKGNFLEKEPLQVYAGEYKCRFMITESPPSDSRNGWETSFYTHSSRFYERPDIDAIDEARSIRGISAALYEYAKSKDYKRVAAEDAAHRYEHRSGHPKKRSHSGRSHSGRSHSGRSRSGNKRTPRTIRTMRTRTMRTRTR